ncbi:MAG: hypothetical protein EBT13_11705 [Rhodobacteraceae bacterium]|nr:hypothetical protein [Paracoccaceae bacterium]
MASFLVPIDGSEHATRAVDYVIKRAGASREPIEVHLLTVQVPLTGVNVKLLVSRDSIEDYYREEGTRILEPSLERLRAAGIAAWRDEATRLWPEFALFASQITDPDQMTMARYSHGTARRPWGDGIVSIGDAAHRASPQLGQGANMALLDAYALARAIGATHHLPDALRAYGLGRRWHVRTYQAFSAVFTPQYQSDSRVLPALRDHVLFPMSQIPPVPRVLSALVRGTLLPPLGSLGPL